MSAVKPVAAMPTRLMVRYFDGRSSRPHVIEAWLETGELHMVGPRLVRRVPLSDVRWSERTRHGPRLAHLPDGGSLQAMDATAWDAWLSDVGRRDGWVVRAQQSWRVVAASLVLLLVLAMSMYLWGVPGAARVLADHVPDRVEQQVGEAVLTQLSDMTAPSRLSLTEQDAVRRAWDAVRLAHSAAETAQGRTVRPSQLLIRHSNIGPNAVALPGGVMLLTDDMVRLVRHDTQVIAGVLGHELGHVQHRHGMRALLQVGLLGAAASLLWGDFSGLLSAVPVWLGQAHYSREAEREADAYSVAVLRAAGISPTVMITLFERLVLFERCGSSVLKTDVGSSAACAPLTIDASEREASAGWSLGFASHPTHEERIAFFRSAAR